VPDGADAMCRDLHRYQQRSDQLWLLWQGLHDGAGLYARSVPRHLFGRRGDVW
jgi:hypothetical protein